MSKIDLKAFFEFCRVRVVNPKTEIEACRNREPPSG